MRYRMPYSFLSYRRITARVGFEGMTTTMPCALAFARIAAES
jgi:hypothetical protein